MDYLTYFQLDDDPFRLTPDPQYFFPSYEHNEILNSLNYAIEQKEGFSLVIGQPGTGKTTILRIVIDHWKDRAEIALVMTPRLSPEEFLRAVLEDLNIKIGKKGKNEMLKSFRDILIQQSGKDKRIIIIVDEAQNLPDDTIEELRLLSNLETEKEKLLQIILMGQPELKKKLEQPHFRQLDQRITIRAILRPLTKAETSDYINFRLVRAGKGTVVFDDEARAKIYAASKGIPRVINLVASRALMAAYVAGSPSITKDHVGYAIQHLAGESKTSVKRYLPYILSGTVAAAIVLAVAGFHRFSGLPFVAVSRNAPAVAASGVPAGVSAAGAARAEDPTQPSRTVGKQAGAMPPESELPKPQKPQQPQKKVVVVSSQGANMRSGPDLGAEKVAWVMEGTSFPVISQKNDRAGRLWYRVEYPTAKQCWVSDRVAREKK